MKKKVRVYAIDKTIKCVCECVKMSSAGRGRGLLFSVIIQKSITLHP